MAEKLFFGNETLGTPTAQGGDFHLLHRFQSSYTGIITKLRYYSTASGNNKPNLYSGSSSSSLTRLWYKDTNTAHTGSQWNDVSGLAVAVTSGNYYWIGGNGSTAGIITRSSATGGSRAYKAATFSTFTAPATPSGYTDDANFLLMSAWGWAPPTITSIDADNTISSCQTGVNLICTDGMNSQGTGKLYLSDNATYGAGTMVEQTINSWSDTGINFDVVPSTLTLGTIYAYLLTDLGQYNSTGFQLTMFGGVWAFVTNDLGQRSRGFKIC